MISLIQDIDGVYQLAPLHKKIISATQAKPGWWNAIRFVGRTKYHRHSVYRAVMELRLWGYLKAYEPGGDNPGRWFPGPRVLRDRTENGR